MLRVYARQFPAAAADGVAGAAQDVEARRDIFGVKSEIFAFSIRCNIRTGITKT